jgi:hypothetical protein
MTLAGDGAGSGFVRRKAVSAHNDATMRTIIDFGEAGRLTLDEPVPHGGSGQGPSPLQAVLGALCGCEAVTPALAASGVASACTAACARSCSALPPFARFVADRYDHVSLLVPRLDIPVRLGHLL